MGDFCNLLMQPVSELLTKYSNVEKFAFIHIQLNRSSFLILYFHILTLVFIIQWRRKSFEASHLKDIIIILPSSSGEIDLI